jgi:hypothetical protein
MNARAALRGSSLTTAFCMKLLPDSFAAQAA